MFLLVASALGAAIVGWPCQRLNWGWRNVWSTCSVNSFAPVTGQPAEVPQQVPNFWRTSPFVHPTNAIHPSGWYQPQATAIPQYFCNSAMATGSGITSSLRNRCRRAVDAYGSLVRMCAAPAAPQFRTANAVSPDHQPAAGHSPHVSNVAGLTINAQLCLLPTGANAPAQLNTPSNTCPGLLGWFTVVFNACGFTNAPALTPANLPQTPGGVAAYFPIHPNQNTGSVTSGTNGIVSVVAPAVGRVGFFCTSAGVAAPDSWNQSGATFRTGRCRKALDQFGRTAQRCHQSTSALTGPAQAGGYSDPLRLLAIGGPQTATPNGFNLFAPGCNN